MIAKSRYGKVREVLKNVQEWLKNPLAKIGIALILFAGAVAGFFLQAGAQPADLALNVVTEMAGVAFTILVVDALYRRHRQRLETQRLKGQLMREMNSPVNEIARQAVSELAMHGWLDDGTLEGAWLVKANLQEADLWRVNLRAAKLSRANLKHANLDAANLQAAYLWGADLQEAHAYEVKLQRAVLMEANLRGAILWSAHLQGADLRGANLQEVDLLGANLQEADLRGVLNLSDEQLAKTYILRGAMMPDGGRCDGRFNLLGDIKDARKQGVDTDSPEAMAEWYGVSLEEYQRGQTWAREHLKRKDEVSTDIVIKNVEPLPVAAVRDVIPTYRDCDLLFAEVYAYLRQHGIRPSGPEIGIYYDTEYRERKVDMEAAVPVGKRLPDGERVKARVLPGIGMMASVVHQGSLDDLGKTYTALLNWIEANGYCITGPNREVYLRGPGSGEHSDFYVIELQFPVRKDE